MHCLSLSTSAESVRVFLFGLSCRNWQTDNTHTMLTIAAQAMDINERCAPTPNPALNFQHRGLPGQVRVTYCYLLPVCSLDASKKGENKFPHLQYFPQTFLLSCHKVSLHTFDSLHSSTAPGSQNGKRKIEGEAQRHVWIRTLGKHLFYLTKAHFLWLLHATIRLQLGMKIFTVCPQMPMLLPPCNSYFWPLRNIEFKGSFDSATKKKKGGGGGVICTLPKIYLKAN